MKLIKITFGILAVFFILSLGAYVYLSSKYAPQYDGELKITGIDDEVEVYYTEYGVPHIYATTELDAYRTFGYVHAQERLWQMDLLRHVGAGSLARLFGQDLLETDQFLRVHGLNEYAKQSAELFASSNTPSKQLTLAYLDGINQYLAETGGTIEHQILGLDVRPFEVVDVYRIVGYLAISFANAQKTDPLLTSLASKLDSAYLNDLPILNQPGDVTIPSYQENTSVVELATATNRILNNLNIPLFIGSNSWVVGPEKSKSGNTILVNDPHIQFSQPGAWYEAHINTPTSEFYGYFFAGVPFPLLLHNEDLATGLTMFENDDIDFFQMTTNAEGTQYQMEDEWHSFQTRTEIFEINGQENVTMDVRSTSHGPIINDILENVTGDPVALHWSFTKHHNELLEVFYQVTQAETISDAKEILPKIHAPGVNVMYGDKNGNYAWWASARLAERNEQTSKYYQDGNQPPYSKWLDFSQNPQAINPPSGYTYSANNQPDSVNGNFYAGYYLPDDRAERIVTLLEAKPKFSANDMKEMLMDNVSTLTQNTKDVLLGHLTDYPDQELIEGLSNWDGGYDDDSYQAVIFQKWQFELLKAAMYDELGEEHWNNFLETHLAKRTLEELIANTTSIWWDELSSTNKETMQDHVESAFSKSISDLSSKWGSEPQNWNWSDSHTLNHPHTLGVNAVLSAVFNVGPFGTASTVEVINNLGFKYTGEMEYKVSFGPSTRRIVDFADPRNNSWSVLPSGQSGNIFSPHYSDQALMFVNGDFRKMIMSEEDIKSGSSVLRFKKR